MASKKSVTMRDSDVRYVLERIAEGKNIYSKINEPYSLGDDRVSRVYDKVYSFDKVDIYLEAELGMMISNKLFSMIIRGEYEKFKEHEAPLSKTPEMRINDKGEFVKGYFLEIDGFSNSIGPLIDNNAKDEQLETISVRKVRAEYTGLNLNEFSSPEWDAFIEAVRDRYQIEKEIPCKGIIKISEIYPSKPLIDNSANGKESLVFVKEIRSKADLERGIASVYAAGKTVEKARDDMANRLIRQYLYKP